MNLTELDDIVKDLSWAGLLYLSSLVVYELADRKNFLEMVGEKERVGVRG